MKINSLVVSDYISNIGVEQDHANAFNLIKKDYDNRVKELENTAKKCSDRISNAFVFLEKAFGEGQEILIVVTEMTTNAHFSKFISQYGCEDYFRHNKDLLFYERQRDIDLALKELNLYDEE